MIEANIDTVVPECPMYAEKGAHVGSVFEAAALPPELELEQAASSMEPATADVMSAIRVRFARPVMASPSWRGRPGTSTAPGV